MKKLLVIFLFLTVASGNALAKDIKSTLTAADSGEIWFNTAGSFKKPSTTGGAYEISNKPVQLVGDLRLPDGNGPFPAVILVHGCAGKGYAEPTWVPVLKEWGYATFAIDSFTPRGFSEVCTDPWKLISLERVADVYGALRILATHPKINKDAIALMGWSHGGITTVNAATMWAKQNFAPDGNPTFKAFFPFYPYCNPKYPEREEISAPVRIHTGEADDWTPAKPCSDWVDGLKAKGADASITLYKGAGHGFDDGFGTVTHLRNVVNGATCTPTFSNILGPYDLAKNFPSSCFKKGATTGRSPRAIEEAKSALKPQLDDLMRGK